MFHQLLPHLNKTTFSYVDFMYSSSDDDDDDDQASKFSIKSARLRQGPEPEMTHGSHQLPPRGTVISRILSIRHWTDLDDGTSVSTIALSSASMSFAYILKFMCFAPPSSGSPVRHYALSCLAHPRAHPA